MSLNFSRCLVPKALALAGLILLVLSAGKAAQAQTFTFTSSVYTSPTFVDSLGTFTFNNSGRVNATFTASAVPTNVFLDSSASGTFTPIGANADPPTIFSGTASTLITINGLGSQTITQNYTLDGTRSTATLAVFSAGSPITFNLANGTQLVLTPTAFNAARQVSVQIVPLAVTPAPEPSSAAALGFGGLGLAGLAFKARRRKTSAGKAAGTA